MGQIADFFKDVHGGLKNLFKTIDEVDQMTTASLTSYITKVSISATVYVQQSVADDDIAVPLMGCLNQMYACWILCALGLDTRCSDGRTVADRLAVVKGLQMLESDLLSEIKSKFGTDHPQIKMSNEAGPLADVESNVSRLATGRLIEFDFSAGQGVIAPEEKNLWNFAKDEKDRMKDPDWWKKDPASADPDTYRQTVEEKIRTTKGNEETKKFNYTTVKAYFYVMMHPFMINADVSDNFMQLNFVPTLSQRWKAVRAGEITFWKDFMFARDMINKQARLLKHDKSGIVAEMMDRQRSGVWRWIGGMLGLIPTSHNLSNAILIFDKRSFDNSCREAHIDFDNVSQRMAFFRKTFTMMVVVVDSDYGRVDMYYAGVPQVGNYNFKMINKIGADKNDSFDLKQVMTAFSAGNAPRF